MNRNDTGQTERRGVGIAINAFESIGFAFREQSVRDFGIDAHAELMESNKPTGQLLAIQLKSGHSYFSETKDDNFIYRIDRTHVEYWVKHALPVLICLCNINQQFIFWQIVNTDTAISTRNGFKFEMPQKQKIDIHSFERLKALLTPLVSNDRFTIFKEEDRSHGNAKIYSLDAVVNGAVSKAEIAAIVRKLTSDGVKRRYHRNHLVEGRWGDSDAHVVWTYIYLSAEDHARHNHICRSLWISENLPSDFRPMAFDGENVGDGIIVDWTSYYNNFAQHIANNRLLKEEYLSKTLPYIEQLKAIFKTVKARLIAFSKMEITEDTFLSKTEKLLNRIHDIYKEVSNIGFAPYECRDMDQKLKEFIIFLDDINLLYSQIGFETWDEKSRQSQALQKLLSAQTELEHFEYELSKIV